MKNDETLFWSCFVFFGWLLHYYHPKLHLAIGGVIHLSSLKVNDGYNLHHMQIQKLFSEFEICFHGFGGGAERMATVDGLYDDQCWISNSLLLFYNAVHNKQASVRSPSKNPVKHQPPPSIVLLFILFHKLFVSESQWHQWSNTITDRPHIHHENSSLCSLPNWTKTSINIGHLSSIHHHHQYNIQWSL